MSNRTDTGIASLREGLIKARALIDTSDKWCKIHFAAPGQHCTMGALEATVGHDRAYGPYRTALLAALPNGFPYVSVINFNDDPSTTHADIMALFDRAIASLGPVNTIESDLQVHFLHLLSNGMGLADQEVGLVERLDMVGDALNLAWAAYPGEEE